MSQHPDTLNTHPDTLNTHPVPRCRLSYTPAPCSNPHFSTMLAPRSLKMPCSVSFTFFGIGSFLAAAHHVSKLFASSASKDDAEQVKKTRLIVAKHALTVIACAHISDQFKTHESIAGFTGMGAVSQGAYSLYPILI